MQASDKQDEKIFNKEINVVPAPEKEIGIDINDVLMSDISVSKASNIDIGKINAFSTISQKRDQLYSLLDSMASDSIVSAILETYAEDATERNELGKIVWAESSNAEISNYINFLLDSLNIDKNIYHWVYSLCKYGDIYLRLFRESQVEDPIFKNAKNTSLNDKKNNTLNEELNENVNVKVHKKSDNYVFYIEQVPNPAEIFELTKFGKSYGYIDAPTYATTGMNNANSAAYYYSSGSGYYNYKFKQTDIDIYAATEFVHGCLEDTSDRYPEKVNIFLSEEDLETDKGAYSYTVRRGQSLLYDAFKIWRQLMLLENSILLNRLTKSSVVRILGVEVGDMPKEKVQATLHQLKSMIEQKSAINESIAMSEYTNPGSYENIIYLPIRNQQGTITTTEIGATGDTGSGNLSDLDYFKNKFYGALKIPKQYFGDTDDAAGFDAGKSLALLSSRYAKTVKRIQTSMLQAITDAINLFLIDKDLSSYINNFSLHMVLPTTQEELDRREATTNKLGVINDIMGVLADIEDPIAKLKIEKALLSNTIINEDVINIISEEITRMEQQAEAEEEQNAGTDNLTTDMDDLGDINLDFSDTDQEGNDFSSNTSAHEMINDNSVEKDTSLPKMDDIGLDFADSNNF